MSTEYRVEVFLGKIQPGWKPRAFYWRVKHQNGNKLVTSEAYTRKATALRIATRLAEAAGWRLYDFTGKKGKK